MDGVCKPGQRDGLIPANVANAVNFTSRTRFFTDGPKIAAAEPTRTRILGNFRITCGDQPIATSGTSWLARLFMQSHVQIEEDPYIWQQASALINQELSRSGSAGQEPPSGMFTVDSQGAHPN